MAIRVRFAPSPTGSLHLGGLRTALFNYLFAKKNNGRYIVRLEDTDKSRTVPGAAAVLTKVLHTLGIPCDEGPEAGGLVGPYVQSQRLHLYSAHSERLLESGRAYRCFCSKERLKALSSAGPGPGPGYDGHCRGLGASEAESRARQGAPSTVRLKVKGGASEPGSAEGASLVTEVRDEVYGAISFPNAAIDDQILMKSDGFPTYHFANVIDDHLMGISHVIRGEEWLSSTPKHLLLYKSFGWDPPRFVHLPLLLRKSGQGKLSKRDSSASVEAFLNQGYLPQALLNFVALLGWSPANGRETLTLEEMVEVFDVCDLNKAAPRVDTARLQWFQKQHFQQLYASPPLGGFEQQILADFSARIRREYGESMPAEHRARMTSDCYVKEVLASVQETTQLMPAMVEAAAPFYVHLPPPTPLEGSSEALVLVLDALTAVRDWSEPELKQVLAVLPKTCGRDRRAVFKLLRSALMGSEAGRPLLGVLETLGKDLVCQRLQHYVHQPT